VEVAGPHSITLSARNKSDGGIVSPIALAVRKLTTSRLLDWQIGRAGAAQDVVDMNRSLGGDVSLNAPIREEGDSGEWQDWLVDEISDQETRLAESEESNNRRKALGDALTVLNDRERRIFEARRLADDPITLEDLASEFGVSRERVRQIEVRAFEKVQRAVKNRVAAMEMRPAAAAAAPVPAH
jgi:RNA polymerase sigma-32 factor